MIDTVELTWGTALHTPERRARRSALKAGRVDSEPRPEPVHLDWRDLVNRLGSPKGEVQRRLYDTETGSQYEQGYGHWTVGDVGLLYRDGRVQLRASLPKITAGQNDTVLDERGVHDGLRQLCKIGSELAGAHLDLADATPSRLDYVYSWDVPSVAFVLEHLRAAFPPGKKLRTENVSPTFGGRSLVFGYGGKRVLRWYDKGAECAEKAYKAGERELTGLTLQQLYAMPEEARKLAITGARRRAREDARQHGNALGYTLDTQLRYEVQDRRRPHLRLVHEQGYRAGAIRAELTKSIERLSVLAAHDLDTLIRDGDGKFFPGGRRGFAIVCAALYLHEHDEAWALADRHLNRSTKWRWQQRARIASLAVGDWRPSIPDAAFDTTSLWQADAA